MGGFKFDSLAIAALDELIPGKITVSDTEPPNPSANDIWIDTSTLLKSLRVATPTFIKDEPEEEPEEYVEDYADPLYDNFEVHEPKKGFWAFVISIFKKILKLFKRR